MTYDFPGGATHGSEDMSGVSLFPLVWGSLNC